MNEKEARFFSAQEQQWADCTAFPLSFLLKALFVKVRRRLLGRFVDRTDRFVWTSSDVADAYGPGYNVRCYLERNTIRTILNDLTRAHKLSRACEIGCGYGRVIMVLAEFAEFVKGFEREKHLVDIARHLLPNISFQAVQSLPSLEDNSSYDLVMTCTVLQHMTDSEVDKVCEVMKRLARNGHILCIEKTEPISITANYTDPGRFISRARSVADYEKLMQPFRLVRVVERPAEPGYFNPRPGSCMLFESPHVVKQ
jgi:2-polyprenyl-3-methyl-5-hydroxy-6-metoxy-1,4-benzoquinol methylase